MGNGNDTILLSSLCKETGHVYAFDIQEQALAHTRQRLLDADAPQNYTLLLESHTNMDHYVQPESVSCIVFNLGYLPGGDHTKATQASSSIEAVTRSLSLQKKAVSSLFASTAEAIPGLRNAMLSSPG